MPKFTVTSFKPVVIGNESALAAYEWVDTQQRSEELASLLAGQGTKDPYGTTMKLMDVTPVSEIPALVLPAVVVRRALITSGETARAGESTFTMADVLRQRTSIPLFLQGRNKFDVLTRCVVLGDNKVDELNIDAGEPCDLVGFYIVNNWTTRLRPDVIVRWAQYDEALKKLRPGESVTCLGSGGNIRTKVRNVRTDGVELENDGVVMFSDVAGGDLLVLPDGIVDDYHCFGTLNIIVMFDGAASTLVRAHLLPSPEAWLDTNAVAMCDMRDVRDVFGTVDVSLQKPFRSCPVVEDAKTRHKAWKMVEPPVHDASPLSFAIRVHEAALSTSARKRKATIVQRPFRKGVSALDIKKAGSSGLPVSYGPVYQTRPAVDGMVMQVDNRDFAGTKVCMYKAKKIDGITVYELDVSKAAIVALEKSLPEGSLYDVESMVAYKDGMRVLVDTNTDVKAFMHDIAAGLMPATARLAPRQMRGTDGKKYVKYEGSEDAEKVTFIDAFVPVNDSSPEDVISDNDDLDVFIGQGTNGLDLNKLLMAFADVTQIKITTKHRAWGLMLINKTMGDMQAVQDSRSLIVRATCTACAVFSLMVESDPVAMYTASDRGWELPEAVVDAIAEVSSSKYFFEHNVNIRRTDALLTTVKNIRSSIIASDPLIQHKVQQSVAAMKTLMQTLGSSEQSRRNGETWASFRPSLHNRFAPVLRAYVADSKQFVVHHRFVTVHAFGVARLEDSPSHWSDVSGLPVAEAAPGYADARHFARHIDTLRVITYPDALTAWESYNPPSLTMSFQDQTTKEAQPHQRDLPPAFGKNDVQNRAEAIIPSRKGAAAEAFYELVGSVTTSCNDENQSMAIQRYTHRSLRTAVTQLKYARSIIGTLRDDRRSQWIRANIQRSAQQAAVLDDVDGHCQDALPASNVDGCQSLGELLDIMLMLRDKLKMQDFSAFANDTFMELGTHVKFNTMSLEDIQADLEEMREIEKLSLMSILEKMDDNERLAFTKLRDRGFTWDALLHDRRIVDKGIDREGYDMIDVPETDE